MLLNELYGIKNDIQRPAFGITGNPPDYKQNANEIAKKYGFEIIGKGVYANVYHHPSKTYVIKFFESISEVKGYIQFIKFCKNNKNKHLPIIGNVFKIKDSRYYAVKLEKLYPINEQDWKKIFLLFNKINTNTLDSVNDNDIDLVLLMKQLKNINPIDLHDENFMKRDDGVIVIIDPWVG
jgi:hypothetical protein